MDVYEDEYEEVVESGAEIDEEGVTVDEPVKEDHERALEMCRVGLEICRDGIEKFPDNIEILASAIKFATQLGEEETAQGYYDRIKGMPYKRWQGETYGFVMDFLMLHPEKNTKEINLTIQESRKHLTNDEIIYLKEYEFYDAIGEHTKSIDTLKKAVSSLTNASKAALLLLNIHLERGEYQEAVSVGEYTISQANIQDPKELSRASLMTLFARDSVFQMDLNCRDKITGDQENMFLLLDDMYEFIINNFSSQLSEEEIALAKTKREILKLRRIMYDI